MLSSNFTFIMCSHAVLWDSVLMISLEMDGALDGWLRKRDSLHSFMKVLKVTPGSANRGTTQFSKPMVLNFDIVGA